MKIKLTDIIIKLRQREDLGDCKALADSLIANGQIQPIGVNSSNELIWGRRRLEAARIAGWDEIEAIKRDGLTPFMEQMLEYEEDIRRKDRSWQEKCTALLTLHNMMSAEKGRIGESWFLTNTKELTGLSKTSVHYMLQIGRALRAGDKAVIEAASYNEAIKVLVQRQRDEVTAEMERRRQAAVAPAAPEPSDSTEITPEEDLQFLEEAESLDGPPAIVTHPAQARPVQALNPTVITIYGYMREPGPKDASYGAILSYKRPAAVFPTIRSMLAPKGWAFYFHDSPSALDNLQLSAEDAGMFYLPWPVIWSKGSSPTKLPMPFSPSYAIGVVLHNTEFTPGSPAWPNPETSVIACGQQDGFLPMEVISHVLTPISNEGDRVVCLGAVNPADVAICGRIPFFFEPDAERFQAKRDALVAFYTSSIPNCVIKDAV